MLTATQCAIVDPPTPWDEFDFELGPDTGRLARFRSLLFGRAVGDDTSPTGSSDHRCFYRTLAEAAIDVVTVVDHTGTIVYKSPSAEHHLGTKADDFLGHNLFEYVHVDDLMRVKAVFDEGLRTNSPTPPIEHRLRHRDGTWRTFESVGRFQADLALGRLGIVHSRDVSARKVLEAQVRQAQKMEAVGLSTGAIAHDFNNMLVVIAGYTALLATDPSPTVRTFAREMRMATDRATELTGQLLSYSRATQIDDQACDINDVITDFRPILDRMVGRDVRVSYVLDAAPSRVAIGRSALDQVLINLVVNARDAMPAGGALSVATSNERRPRLGDTGAVLPPVEHVVVTVTDSGIGMTDDIKARIFEPFFTTKAPGRGTGIGLQTVFGIVQQAGGGIDVISAPGAGTTFRVLLPVHPFTTETAH